MKSERFYVKTNQKNEMINITYRIKEIISNARCENGIAVIFTPHTTAAITINENADPDVKTDLLYGLDTISPVHDVYKHFEGNSDAHLKSSLIGISETIIVEDSKPLLGTWQGIYFCEFDGPRERTVIVKVID